MCCLAEHPQARVVYNEVLCAADKDASSTKLKGAWPVQEAYLVSVRSCFMFITFQKLLLMCVALVFFSVIRFESPFQSSRFFDAGYCRRTL